MSASDVVAAITQQNLQVAAGQLTIADTGFAAEQFFSLCQTRIGMLRRLGLVEEIDEAMLAQVVDRAVAMFLNTYGVKQ